MGAKRKSGGGAIAQDARTPKKPRQEEARGDKTKLSFTPRPDWHAAEVSTLPTGEVRSATPQRMIEELHQYAINILEAENSAYNSSQISGSSSHKFLATIMSSGTLEDKVSALTLLVQESPLHTMKAFENLMGLSKKKSRNQALMALAALKDLLGQGVVLPGDRKLRAFGKQPALLYALQSSPGRWIDGQPLPGGIEKAHLMMWAYEDWLKKSYFELLQILESWCGDEVEYARSRAITYVWELLKDKPEQEENLLRLLVNKLGDTDRKIASRASYLLLQLETTHPAMKQVVTDSIEADCLLRPGQSLHARYYAIITLNQTILSQKEQKVANRLLDIYFDLFVQSLKPSEKGDKDKGDKATGVNANAIGKVQHGGGKPGRMAAKKVKAQERLHEADGQLREKMTAQILTGVNRAFPFADTSDPTFEKQIDTLFRVTHSANFSTAIQALMLLQQISSTKHYGAERFYRTLYESLLDPRLVSSSKQVLYLNLLYKSLKADLNVRRVQAFVKRLLQTITLHEPPFVCGVLYLISELQTTFPSIKNMVNDPEANEDDDEERFFDVPEDGQEQPAMNTNTPKTTTMLYDARKRDPEHAHAEQSCLWDLLPFLQHFHPSVSLFADALVFNKVMPPKPDPSRHTLMHFLDRFVYRNARAKQSAGTHGSSIMQPMGGSSAADLLVKPGEDALRSKLPVNSDAFWQKKVQDIAADEVFFHSYFNQASNKRRKHADKEKKRDAEDEDEDEGDGGEEEEGEDEIWQAIVNSRPEVEGPDSDDDLSMGDLESAYSDSDEQSEAGIDLGGDEDDDGDMEESGVLLDEDESDGDEGTLPDLDDGDEDAMFGDDDEVPFDLVGDAEPEEEDNTARNKRKRKEKKKLKQLPTFASADDYAKLLADEPDDV